MPDNNFPFPLGARLVAYCRDSGGRDQDLSIPQQESKIGEWCHAHGYALVHVFKDAARSGTTTAGRDQFLDMFSYLTNGADVAGVVLWEYARLSRSYDDAMFYLADLRRQGYAIYSLSDQIPEGMEGRLMESIIAWKNAKYSADLSRNVKRGKAYVVTALHGWPHAVAPTGYQKEYTQLGTRRDGTPHLVARLVPDPAKAPLVQRAFELRAQGASYTEIRQQVPLVGRNSSLAPILHNPIYTGTYDYNGLRIENYCPAIVDPDTWQAAQQINEAARTMAGTYHPRRIRSKFLLSGLAHCARCGAPLTGLHTKPKQHLDWYSYYHCPNRPYKRTADTYCDAPGIRKELLEGRVLDLLIDLLDKPQLLADVQAEIANRTSARDATHQAMVAGTHADLAAIGKSISRIVDAIRAAGHSQALINDLTTLEQKRDELQADLVSLATRAPSPHPAPDVFAVANSLRPAITTATGADLQKLFRLVIVSIQAEYTAGVLAGNLHYNIADVTGVLSL